MSDEKVVSSTFPVFSLLTIIFVIAKIMGKIDWPWWLVLLPTWGPLALLLAILVGFGIVWLILWGIVAITER